MKNKIIFYFFTDVICHSITLTINFTSPELLIIKKILFKAIVIIILLQLQYILTFYTEIKNFNSKLNNIFYIKIFLEVIELFITNINILNTCIKIKNINIFFLFLCSFLIIKNLIYLPFYDIYYSPTKMQTMTYLKIIFILIILKVFFIDYNIILYSLFPSSEENIHGVLTNYDFLHYFFIFSFVSYSLLIFFAKIEKRFNELSKPINMDNDENDILLKFSIKEIEKILYHMIKIEDFLISLIGENIVRVLEENISYKIFLKKDFFLYYRDIQEKECNTIIEKDTYIFFTSIYEKIILSKIIERKKIDCTTYNFLKKKNILLIHPAYINNELYSYTVIYKNHNKILLLEKELLLINQIHRSIEFFIHQIINNELYIKLQYQKKIYTKNIIEQDERFIQNNQKMNELVNNISCFILYEKNKKYYLISNLEEDIIKEELKDSIIKYHMSQLNQQCTEKNFLLKKYFFLKNEKNSIPIMTTKKMKIGKRVFSTYICLPFLNSDLKLIDTNFFYKEIEEILFSCPHNFLEDKELFSKIYDTFEIKILISKNIVNQSFLNIIEYFAQKKSYIPLQISLKNIDCLSYEKIVLHYHYLTNLKENYLIILKEIDENEIAYQKKLINKYITYFTSKESFNHKIIILLSHNEALKYIEKDIYEVSKIHFFTSKEIKVIDKTINHTIINYFKNILKKNTLEEDILKSIQTIKNYNNLSIYDLIDSVHTQLYLKKYHLGYHDKEKYIQKALILRKSALKDHELMKKLSIIYNNNYTEIANTIGVHKSTISRYFKKNN